MKPLYCRSVNSKGAGRLRLSHHHKGGWNETKWMRWVWRNGGMKFVVWENGRNPEKNLPRPRFVHHETHMEWPRRELGTPAVRGERLTACATRPPQIILLKIYFSEEGRLLASFTIEREKFYPGPRLEPRSPALRAGALTTEVPRTSTDTIQYLPLVLIPSGLRNDNPCHIMS